MTLPRPENPYQEQSYTEISNWSGGLHNQAEDIILATQQAFIDAGWVRLPGVEEIEDQTTNALIYWADELNAAKRDYHQDINLYIATWLHDWLEGE